MYEGAAGGEQHDDGVGTQRDAGGQRGGGLARGRRRAPRRRPHALHRHAALRARRADWLAQRQPEQQVVQLRDLQVGRY